MQELCSRMGLPDATKEHLCKLEVKDAVKYHHLKTLKEKMPVKGKLAEMRNTYMTNMQKYMLSQSLA